MRRRGVAPFSLMHLLPSSKDRACPSPQCALVRRVSVGVILVYDMPERNCFFHVRASVIDLGETAQFKRNRSAIEKIGRNMRRGRERHGCRSGGSVRFAAQEDGRGIPEQKRPPGTGGLCIPGTSGLFGRLFPRRVECAGIVDLGDLMVGEAEHLAQDLVGVLAEQR